MSTGSIVGFACAGSLLMAGCLSFTAEAKIKQPRELKDLIAGYRSWRKANTEPIHMAPTIAQLCRSAMPWETSANPHQPKFFTVFVNKTGENALFKGGAAYPVGTVIVKEKLPSAKAEKPELLTVMVKKEKGYDTAHGDWQYFTADGPGQQVSQEKIERCQSCHEAQKAQDYVFANYLWKSRMKR